MEPKNQALQIRTVVYKIGTRCSTEFYVPGRELINSLQLVWCILAIFDMSILILWVTGRTSHNHVTYLSAFLSLLGALILALLSYLEHMRSIRPSFLLSIYLLLTVAFDTARSRSYGLDSDLDTIASVFSSRVGVKLVLAILEAMPKERLLLPDFEGCPPEAASGMYKRSLFWWLNALFKHGYSEILTIDDLFHLDKHLQSDYLHQILMTSWSKCTSASILPILSLRLTLPICPSAQVA